MRAASLVALLVVLAFGGLGCAGATGGDPTDDLGEVDLTSDGKAVADAATGDLASNGAPCNPSATVLGAAGGPDACAYGELCDPATMKCKAVPTGSCNMVGGAPSWDAAGKAAPVIAKVSAMLLPTTDAQTECANGDPAALVTIEYYAPMTLTATTSPATFLPQVKFKKSMVLGDPFYSGTFMRQMPAASQKVGSFKVGINCGGAGGAVKQAGLYILDGGGRSSNPVCVTW